MGTKILLRSVATSAAFISILACSFTAGPTTQTNDISTIVAGTFQALTVPAPASTQEPATGAAPTQAAAQGIPVSSGNVEFIIPAGLAGGALAETVPAVDEQSGAPWEVSPAYIRFTLQNYPLQDKFFQPQIMVYPAQDYAAVGAGAAISIQRLQAILASPAAPLGNDVLPRLPYANADQIIGAKAKMITFNGGSGLRVLAEYAQNFAVIDNHDLFYHFEGLTSDGKSYTVATLPINAGFLAADSNPASPVPAGGVPFPGYASNDATTFENYYQAVSDKLNSTPPEAFTPSLTWLDSLIQSLEVSR